MSETPVNKLTVQALSSATSTAVDGISGDGGVPTEVEFVGNKRARPPRIPASSAVRKRSKKDDEDVCFICFDGGSLVLCDRRDCPKVYHPSCVKRDDSFFLPDIRWDCGWHFCNICQKNAIFLCYTCPYSLCKGCVKQADILRIRGNKGFCRTCMSTIMLFEKIPQENKELAQVDFDDKTSWEYLFKVYWIFLKERENLTLDELLQASNPWKSPEIKVKNNFQTKVYDPCYSKSHSHLEADTSKRRKVRKQQQPLSMDSQKIGKVESNKGPGLPGQPDWASKELLEFVAYMKNGDMSSASELDVQALPLDYIKNDNLRDPRQKCQIICDKRLENLFGKERVGDFEMLKLLEYHFKEESSSSSAIHGGNVGSDLPSASPKLETNGLKISIAENKDTLAPNLPIQDSGINWRNVLGGARFPAIATDPLKLNVDVSRGIILENNHCPPLQVHEQDFCINWSATSSLGGEAHLPNAAGEWGWQPIELSTLGDDSVSDLLSEVEAMEALRGMSSPTSQINCGDDLIGSPGDECFSPLGGLTLNRGLEKNDALSSTSSIHFHAHHNQWDPRHVPFHLNICDIQNPTGNASYR